MIVVWILEALRCNSRGRSVAEALLRFRGPDAESRVTTG